MDAGPVALDFGYILYTYPVGDAENDFGELYVNLGWEWLSAGLYYNTNKEASSADTGDVYAYFGGDFEVGKGIGLGFVVGRYDFKGGSELDYNHLQLSVSKDDFTLAFDKNDADPSASGWDTPGVDDYRFTVSYSKTFDLM